MAMIYHNNGISQSELAEKLDIRPQSLRRVLVLLEEQGYIFRERSKADRRTVGVYIVEEGTKHHKKAIQQRKKRANLIFGCLNDKERDELYDILNKVVDSYKERERK